MDDILCRGRMPPPPPQEIVVEVLEQKGRFYMKVKQNSEGVVKPDFCFFAQGAI